MRSLLKRRQLVILKVRNHYYFIRSFFKWFVIWIYILCYERNLWIRSQRLSGNKSRNNCNILFYCFKWKNQDRFTWHAIVMIAHLNNMTHKPTGNAWDRFLKPSAVWSAGSVIYSLNFGETWFFLLLCNQHISPIILHFSRISLEKEVGYHMKLSFL